jgi:hypothetical protein
MRGHRVLTWVPLSVMGLAAGGAAALGVLEQPSLSAAAQLDAAFSATNNATSLIVSAPNHRGEYTVAYQNLEETFDHGTVSQIWADNGHTVYTAIPATCATKAKFTESHPTELLTLKPVGFGGDDVRQNGDTFTVSKDGQVLFRLVVQNGYVVQDTSEPRELPGEGIAKMTTLFSDINHAPRVVVPAPSEVVVTPQLFSGPCPL